MKTISMRKIIAAIGAAALLSTAAVAIAFMIVAVIH